MNKKILLWQIIGIIFAVVIGSMLHFVFEWLKSAKPVALIGAVNESTWEHLKIGFWPAFVFAIIEYFSFGKKQKNFCLAKMVNLYLIPILIIAFFYGYMAIIEDNLFMDIFIFILAIVIAYLISYKIIVSQKDFSKLKALVIILIIIEIAAFSLFTYFPPHNFLFKDPVFGGYGIIK